MDVSVCVCVYGGGMLSSSHNNYYVLVRGEREGEEKYRRWGRGEIEGERDRKKK